MAQRQMLAVFSRLLPFQALVAQLSVQLRQSSAGPYAFIRARSYVYDHMSAIIWRQHGDF